MCSLPEPVPSLLFASPAEAPFEWLLLAVIPLVLAQRYLWYVRKVPGRQNQWRLMRLHMIGILIAAAGGMLLLGVVDPWSSAVESWDTHALVQAQNPCVLAAVSAANNQARVVEYVLMLVRFGCLALGWILGFRAVRLRQEPPHPVEEVYG